MADSFTPKLNLTKPEVGASTDTWGTKVNADFDTIDALFDTGPFIKIANGGTGAGTAADARTNLGLGELATKTLITSSDITDATIVYADIQNISATSRVLGRKTSGAGVTEELTLSDILDFVGSAAQGDILYRDSGGWSRLGAGTSGQILTSGGSGAAPSWSTLSTLTLGTAIAASSGSASFTGIPDGVKRITISWGGVTVSGNPLVQIGTSGGYITSGYTSASSTDGGSSGSSSGFVSRASSGYGLYILAKVSDTVWTCMSSAGDSSGSGFVTFSGTIDRVRVTASTFTGGTANIMYE